MKEHLNHQSFMCDVCGKTYNSVAMVNYHRKTHSDVCRWPCYYCDEKFKSRYAFKTHLAKFHSQMKEDLEKRSSLRLHQCHICSKVYGHKSDLQRHINIHEGVKPFKCEYCTKAFNDKESMRCHMKRIHCADTRMKCNYCCKKFVHHKTLKLHEYKVHGIGLVKDNLS